ncbi:Unknown protein sequence [Pseudomonas syringae pv. maculicola]|nr:Unknown protein sequence [Pseudomonas syringae pv. maculicola str. M6]KPB95563.1 Unknown protein sequence [Pseudomonas syringae pv. maculicola]
MSASAAIVLWALGEKSQQDEKKTSGERHQDCLEGQLLTVDATKER